MLAIGWGAGWLGWLVGQLAGWVRVSDPIMIRPAAPIETFARIPVACCHRSIDAVSWLVGWLAGWLGWLVG